MLLSTTDSLALALPVAHSQADHDQISFADKDLRPNPITAPDMMVEQSVAESVNEDMEISKRLNWHLDHSTGSN
jgi:hypothetical protein